MTVMEDLWEGGSIEEGGWVVEGQREGMNGDGGRETGRDVG